MTSLSISSAAGQLINTLASAASKLPIFIPSSSGLDLLASVAAQAFPLKQTLSFPHQLPAISATGPFNPAASLPPKVVKKILELEFVEMAEISIGNDPPQAPGRPSAPARPWYKTSPNGLNAFPSWQQSCVRGSRRKPLNCGLTKLLL